MVRSLFIQFLDEVIDLHTTPVAAFQYHIAGRMVALYLISMLSFGLVGYEIGLSGRGGIMVSIIMALAFSTVILLISDLDRSMEGNG